MKTLNLSRACEVNGEVASPEGVFVRLEQQREHKCWLARIATNKFLAVERTFIQLDKRDFSRAGNGVVAVEVGDGVYEAESIYRSLTPQRVFFRVSEGEVEILTKEEALDVLVVNAKIAASYAEALEAKRLEEKVLQDHQAETLGLCDLEGSEKQVSWAIQLRARVLTSLETRKDKPGYDLLLGYIKSLKKAKSFIDARAMGNESAIAAFTYAHASQLRKLFENKEIYGVDTRRLGGVYFTPRP